MSPFRYHGDRLIVEDVAFEDIAGRFGTPTYVYSRAAIEAAYREYETALAGREHAVLYSVKANSNLAVLGILAELGAGFDIVSVGELERVLEAGGRPESVVFAGVGKRRDEIERALEVGIGCFSVESDTELEVIGEIAARLGKRARIALRVNPDVDPKTHPYIATGLSKSKFGIAVGDAPIVYARAAEMPSVEVVGVGCHIGSQLTDSAPLRDAAAKIVELADTLRANGIPIRHVDLGGGLGIRYRDESPPTIGALVAALREVVDERYALWLAPGRAIVGEAGALLTRVLSVKHTPYKHFAVVDAAMNDLLRPALYGAWHDVQPVRSRPVGAVAHAYDIVGPVCESGDFLARDRELSVAAGDLLAIMNAGAYGFVMSSAYNSRGRAAEVVVDGTQAYLARSRESIEDLMRGEAPLSVLMRGRPLPQR